MKMNRGLTYCGVLLIPFVMNACGGGGGSSSSSGSTASYSLGGTVSNLSSAGLVLSNGSQTVSVASGATSFTFGTKVSGSYSVKVASQPDGQTCSVSSGSGTMSADVSSVSVTCRGYMLYVTNLTGLSIGQYSVTSGTGALAALSTATISSYGGYQPSTIILSSDGQYAYVAHQNNKAIAAYSVSSAGQLTQIGSASGASNSYALALSPDDASLYSADYSAISVSQFSVSSGVPTAMSTKYQSAGVNPAGVVVTPNGKYAYAINSSADTISQYSVGSDGSLTALSTATYALATGLGTAPSSGYVPISLAVDPNSSYLYVVLKGTGTVAQLSISSTGLLSAISPASVTAGSSPSSIAISPNGSYAYVTNFGANTLSQYSITSGRLTAMSTATVATGTGPYSVAVSPDGKYVYVSNYTSGTISQYSIGSGGALTALSTASVSTGTNPTGIAVR